MSVGEGQNAGHCDGDARKPIIDQLKAAAYLDNREARADPTITAGEVRFPPQSVRPGQEYEARVQFPHGLVSAAPPPFEMRSEGA